MTKLEQIRTLETMVDVNIKFGKKDFMEAVCWMILGDGCVETKERGNYNLSISHIIDHTDYILWKASIISHITSYNISEIKASVCKIRDKNYKCKKQLRLRSMAHPWFTKLRHAIYGPLGRKAIHSHALKLLGPLGLAILYQDDGSYHYSKDAGHNILIHKLCFSEFELLAFAKAVVDKFGIIFRLNRCKGKGLGYRLRLRASDRERFFALIEPYIVPSMLYKVGRGGSTKVDGEVLWTSWQHEEADRNDQLTCASTG